MARKAMIAYCGITCTECPAFEATQKGDHEKLAETAAKWSISEMKFEPEDVLCDGCLSDRVFKWRVECPTRRCGMERGVDNCGHCQDYPCRKLRDHWAKFGDGGARCQSTLDRIKKGLKS